jgi:NAD(P)-dependent dehydrogenase (short-subunit alcohol dehydrogenase family)
MITGGSGGLGLLFAGWMVQSGARCVILLGRSGRVAAAADLMCLAAGPAQVVVMRADVSRGEEAGAAAAAAAAVGRRLAGVIHAAGVQVTCA